MKQLAKILAFVPMAMTVIWLQFLPDRVPAHYDLQGNIDRWGSKWETLLLPAVVLVMGVIFAAVGANMTRRAGEDGQKQAHAASNVKVLQVTMLVTGLMFTVLQAYILYGAGRGAAQEAVSGDGIMRITSVCMGILFIVLGNVMPRTKYNSTVGFRCSWSMYNDVTWQRCNRFAGTAMMGAGLIILIGVILAPAAWAVPLLLIVLTACLIVCLCYAHRVYREEKGKE